MTNINLIDKNISALSFFLNQNYAKALEKAGAPKKLILLFKHFSKDEREHRNLLMEIEREAENLG